MSRRKDRERFAAIRTADPNYRGFRGYGRESSQGGQASLTSITCTVCNRRRNVPAEVASRESSSYVCLNCREERGLEVSQEGEADQEPASS